MEEGDNVGRVLVIEFTEQDDSAFDEVMRTLKRHPAFKRMHLSNETMLSFSDLDIYFDRRKIYYRGKEINLTAKEFDILCLLASNKGRVFTYEQIYERLWDEEAFSNVNNTVGCHIRSLRRKLNKAVPDAGFDIRCIRDIGYCLELKTANT